MSAPTGKTAKWAVKPKMVRKKKLDDALIRKIVDWVLHNSNVREFPIVHNTMIIDENGNGDRKCVTKLLLECSVQKLHNEFIAPASEGGLEEAKNRVTGEAIIKNTTLRSIIPGQIKHMQDNHKKICGWDY